MAYDLVPKMTEEHRQRLITSRHTEWDQDFEDLIEYTLIALDQNKPELRHLLRRVNHARCRYRDQVNDLAEHLRQIGGEFPK